MAVHYAGASNALQLDCAGVSGGHVWQIVTGHFTHFGRDHLLWDVSVFLILGMMCEWLDRRRLIRTIFWSIPIISIAVLLCLPGMNSYRGLSGLDSALFGLLTGMLLDRSIRSNNRVAAMLVIGLLVAFATKIVIEMSLGVTVFADSHSGGYVPVPLAHLVGLCIGLMVSGVASNPRIADKMHGYVPDPDPRRRHRPGQERPVA
jgi:rhomboid family GlyGly-CTERM serine protease